MVIMEKKFKDDKEIQAEFSGDIPQVQLRKDELPSILLAEHDSIYNELDSFFNLISSNSESLTNLTKQIEFIKHEMISLKKSLRESHNKQILQKSREKSKNLRKMFNLTETGFAESDASIKLKGLLSENIEGEVDSTEILDEIRERDE